MLEKKIQKGLEDLNFEQVQFEIHFAEKKEYSKDGIDDVEFRISLNQGQQVKPLTEVASGGELSRIMLAIKAVMADKDEIETLIFDEIDVGISGRTAQKVSEKMALIGKEHQVICITHLAQIAAMADQHFLIEKKTEDAVTRTHIYPLTEEKSVEELCKNYRYRDPKRKRDEKSGRSDKIKSIQIQSIFYKIPHTKIDILAGMSIFF